MERWPLDSGSQDSAPMRGWKGTLVAEWTDRGRAGSGRADLEGHGKFAVYMVLGWLAMLSVARSPAGLVTVLGLIVPLYAGLAVVMEVAHRLRQAPPVEVTLLLQPEVLRVTRHRGASVLTAELRRSEASALVREVGSWIELYGRRGTRLQLPGREVAVRMWPFGMAGVEGIDAARASLAVLIGSWWPSDARGDLITTGRWPSTTQVERPWSLPDLSEYGRYRAEQERTKVLAAFAASALLAVMTIAALITGRVTGDEGVLIVVISAGTGVGCLSYGAARLLEARRRLRPGSK